jgi:hypothetical protein
VKADLRYDSYCGLYCGACPILKANVEGTVVTKAEEWELPAADLVCNGCKSKINAGLSADCVMRLCAQDHGLESCGDCDDFPCGTIQTFERDGYPHHTLVIANQRAICMYGVDAWLEKQKERWSCPKCGEGFTWYEEECAKCGAELYDACAEEEDLDNEAAEAGDVDSAFWKLRRRVRRFR